MIIKFGLLGCGYIGSRHAKHIHEHAGAELVSVYDIHAEQSLTLAKQYKEISVASSVEDLINNKSIDIVSICTPSGRHFEAAMKALDAGKHLLIEKPMTLTSKDAVAIIVKAKSESLQVFIVKQNRYNAPVQALKQIIDDGKLGKIFMVTLDCFWNRNNEYYSTSEWKGKKADDGGTLFNQFSHFVDLFFYLFGDIENIHGVITNGNHEGLIEFEDSGVFNFNFLSGAIGSMSFTTAAYEKNMEGSITVFAENGTIKLGGQYLNKIDYQRTKGFDITNLSDSGPTNVYGYYQGSMSNHDRVISNVIDTLNGKSSAMTSAEDGMKVVNIIERMYAAAKWI